MRFLEVVLLILCAVMVLSRLRPPSIPSARTRILAWAALATLVLHGMVDHPRWPLVPVYALTVVLSARALWGRGPSPARRARRFLGVSGGIGLVALSAVLAMGFPVFTAPRPSGPHAVGTTRLVVEDPSRVDPFAPVAGTPRKLLAVVWYPAEPAADAPVEPFWPRGTDATEAIGLPAFTFSQLSLVRSHTVADAPLASARTRWPLVVFSHGFNSTPWQNVVQMEELASHGFVVVSIGHTYDASRLTFPDGEVVRDNSRSRLPPLSSEEQREVARLGARLDSLEHPDSVRAAWRQTEAYFTRVGMYVIPSIEVWHDDVRLVLDRLTAIDAGTDRETLGPRDRFTGRLDLQKVGIAGMSFGGSTAGVTCQRDARCKAGVNMDGWQFGGILDRPLRVPFMYLSREGSRQFPVYFGASDDLIHLEVSGTTHGNFGDISIAMPFFRWISRPNLALLGPAPGEEVEAIMSRYLVAFFRHYLLGEAQPLLEGGPPPPGLERATLTRRRAAGPNEPAARP